MATLLNKIIGETDTNEESFVASNKFFDHDNSRRVYSDEFDNLDMGFEYDELAILHNSEIFEEEIIGPDDTRSKIRNVISPPYRWICSIKTRFYSETSNVSITSEGTGLLIGDRFILTAAHVLHDHFPGHGTLTAKSVYVYLGRNGNRKTFGIYRHKSFRYLNNWKNNLEPRFDFALIKLKGRAPGTRNFPSKTGNRPLGWWGSPSYGYGTVIKGGGKQRFANRKVNLAGYPAKEPRTGRNISGSPTQWISFDSLHQATPNFRGISIREMISYQNDATKSQSGSPIWTYNKESGERNLVAIHRGACKSNNWNGCFKPGSSQASYNLGVHISTSVRNQIQQWKQSM